MVCYDLSKNEYVVFSIVYAGERGGKYVVTTKFTAHYLCCFNISVVLFTCPSNKMRVVVWCKTMKYGQHFFLSVVNTISNKMAYQYFLILIYY